MPQFNLPNIEQEQLKKWAEKGILRQVMGKPSPRGNFVFFEGPPTANGKPGIHHVLARAFKDVILRFRTMQGWHIDRKAGWDTHGLPVELEVEKQLGFTRKQQIEEYGIAQFNAKCKESVWKYLDLWEKMTERIGFWVDLKDPYVTYTNDYVESLWWLLKEIDRKGLLYKGYRVTPHCPRCVTSLSSHELAQGYKDIDDQSIYVKFAVTGADEKKYFLVWTTTPWTLPGNVALAVGADVTYVEARLKATGETFILAQALLGRLDGEYEVLGTKKGADLVGTSYRPLYDVLSAYAGGLNADRLGNAYKVWAADFVSTVDGTGIVHIAPAFGEDDSRLGEATKLPVLTTVDATGLVTADVPGQGKFIKKADEDVKADLAARGLLYKSETYRHAYPFCWRCATPLLYFAKSSWYIRMSELRERLEKNNEQINWVPGHIKEGRFGEWLKEVKDWALSRERYWGTPLPIWQCGCGQREVVGGFDDLKRLGRPVNRYFLQRHGEAENNAGNIVSGWPELKAWKLTAKGREQVKEAAKKLKEKKIDLIFASDIRRTKETAEIIAAELGLPVTYDERLREVGLGELNGKTHAEFLAYYSDRIKRFTQAAPGGETLNDCRRRMAAYVKELESKYAGKNILIVSHGDPIWMLRTGFASLTDEESIKTTYNHVGEFIEFGIERLPYDEFGRVDVHRPFIDEVSLKCPACGGEMKRVSDVIDCWFDSGAMPFAQWHYPFENAARIDSGRNFPADFISEAIDQTRGWFYTLLAISTLLGHDQPPYLNCICLGHVLDAKGQKMSKSKGNVVDPWAMIAKYGADAIRWNFFTGNQPGDLKLFDEKSLDEATKKVFLILWNVLSFWKMYSGTAVPATAPKSDNMLDRWILAKLNELTAAVTKEMEGFDVVGACRAVGEFVNDLSTWYVRRSRDRFKSGTAEEKSAAVGTLGHVLLTLSKLFAPFTPFLADALYAEVGGSLESVHLDEWPAAGAVDQELLDKMNLVRQAAAAGLEKRASAGIPVRQVLTNASVRSPQVFEDWMKEIVAEELNIESVETSVVKEAVEAGVELDTNITPELKRKGAVRELVRQINDLRKKSGLTIKDRVIVSWDSTSDFWKQVIAEHGTEVAAGVLADKFEAAFIAADQGKELDSEGNKIRLAIRKI